MDQFRYKLVALDLDGTVLDNSGRVSARFKALTARLARANVRMVICTGRRWRTALPVVEEIAHASPITVCCGGALIKEAAGHRTLHSNPISSDTARRAVELFRSASLVPFLLLDRPVDGRELLISELDRSSAEQLPYILANQHAVEYYAGRYPELSEPTLEVYTLDHGSRMLGSVETIRDGLGDAAIVTPLSQPRYGPGQIALEVHGPTATKWNALCRLLERWDISPEQVMAIGDDANDIPMLRGAALSFAMGNAPDEVKTAADRVTAGNDEDGAAEALLSAFPELT